MRVVDLNMRAMTTDMVVGLARALDGNLAIGTAATEATTGAVTFGTIGTIERLVMPGDTTIMILGSDTTTMVMAGMGDGEMGAIEAALQIATLTSNDGLGHLTKEMRRRRAPPPRHRSPSPWTTCPMRMTLLPPSGSAGLIAPTANPSPTIRWGRHEGAPRSC